MNSDIWQFKNNICRCCHAEGLFFNLAEPRSFHGEMEVYVDMIKDIFNIKMRPIPGAMCELTYTICMPCIIKLREAIQFKNQVQSCEDKFIDLCLNNKLKVLVFNKTDTAKVNEELIKDVKEEYLVLENDLDRNNDADPDIDANDEDVKEECLALENDSDKNNDANPENAIHQEMESEDDVVMSTRSEKGKEEVGLGSFSVEETEAVSVPTLMQEAEKQIVPVKKRDVKEECLALENDSDKNNDANPENAIHQEMESEDDVVMSTRSEKGKEEVGLGSFSVEETEAVSVPTLMQEAEKQIVPVKKKDVKEECLALENDSDKNNDANPENAIHQEMESEDDVVMSTRSEKGKEEVGLGSFSVEETEAVSVPTLMQEAEKQIVPVKKKEVKEECLALENDSDRNNDADPENAIQQEMESEDDVVMSTRSEKGKEEVGLGSFSVEAVSVPTLMQEAEKQIVPVKKKVGRSTKFRLQPGDYKKTGDIYKCSKCDKDFNKIVPLRFHVKCKHYKIPSFVCESCKKEFMTIVPFTIHKFEEHNIDDRFKCNACKAMFNSKTQLRKHTNNFHMLGEKYKHESTKDGQEEKANTSNAHAIVEAPNSSFQTSNAIVLVPETPESCIEKNDTLKPRLRNHIRNDQIKNDFSPLHLNKETRRLSDEPSGYAAQIPIAVSSDTLTKPFESKDLDVPNQENTKDIDIPSPEKTTTKRKKRSWNRRNCCFYCEKLVTNFTRHIFRHHSKEPEVLRIKAIKDSDPKIQRKKRQAITDDMRNHGNYIHNSKVVSNKEGQLLIAKRTSNEPIKAQTASAFVVCKNCLGTYKRYTFFKHSKKCGGDDTESKKYLARNSMRIIPDLKNASKELIKNRLTRLKNYDIMTKFRLQPGDYKKTGDIYKCCKCDKDFNNIVPLRFHVKCKHYKIPRFVCESCKKEFMTIVPFTIHKFEEHNIDDRFKCNACKAMFNSKTQLRKHTNNFHMLGEKYKHELTKDGQEEKANTSNAHAIVEAPNSSFQTSNAIVLVPETPESCIEKNDTLKQRLRNHIRNDQIKNDFSPLHLNKETRRLSDEPSGYAAQIPIAVSSDRLTKPFESKDLDVPNQENKDIDIPSPEKTTTKRKKRSWNRRNCCFYCEKLVTNFTRHLFRHHSKEPEVLRIKAIKDSDPKIQRKKRQAITDDMRNHGNYIHNSKVVSNKEGQLLIAKRTNNEPIKAQTASAFVVCKNCLGTYKRYSFYKHSKKCGGDDTESKKYLARNSMRIIPDLKNASKELIKNRLTRLKNYDISSIAKNDPLNSSFGCRVLKKKKERRSRKSRCS